MANKHHGVLSKYDDNHEMVKKYAEKITPEEYIDYLTGEYTDEHPDPYWFERFLNKEANTIENNDKIWDILKERKNNLANEIVGIGDFSSDEDKAKANDLNDQYEKTIYAMDKFINNKNFKLSDNKINNILDDPSQGLNEEFEDFNPNRKNNVGIQSLSNQNINEQHLYKILSKNPNDLEYFVHSRDFGRNIMDKYLDKATKYNNQIISKLTTIEDYPSAKIKNTLDKYINQSNWHGSNVLNLLNKLNETDRAKWVDDAIGITGGSHESPFEEEEYRKQGLSDQEIEGLRKDWEDETNWDNWTNGNALKPFHREKLIETLAESQYLNDSQANHIKRHGSTKAKYNLFHNDFIDPKHGVEMHNKWYNDHYEHGYDKEDYAAHYKEKLRNDSDNYEIYDEARERAEQESPISEYIRNHGRYDIERSDVIEHYLDDMSGYLLDEYSDEGDWVDDNPNYDPDDPESPEEIDFRDHPDVALDEHPDYDQRADDAIDDHFMDKYIEEMISGGIDTPENIYTNYDESIMDARYEHEQDILKEKAENSLMDEKHLPSHLIPHIPSLMELKKQKMFKQFEDAQTQIYNKQNGHSDFLDNTLPNRTDEHEYADGLHHHEILKEYADHNNGKIDIGKMNKIYPNLKDAWKKIFENKGKLTSDEIQTKIENLPKKKFGISYDKWYGGGMQNVNNQDQLIFQLNHSKDTFNELAEDPDKFNVFADLQETSQRSGHPTNFRTIAWARVDASNPEHWMIDEVQSDFGSTARDYLKKEGHTNKAKAMEDIIDYHGNWRENIMNYIIKAAKKHGVKKISTHSPESKARHTSAGKVHSVYKDSYQKIPRSLGFKPDSYENLPLTDKGKQYFVKSPPKAGYSDHTHAIRHHGYNYNAHTQLANEAKEKGDEYTSDLHTSLANEHKNLWTKHMDKFILGGFVPVGDISEPIEYYTPDKYLGLGGKEHIMRQARQSGSRQHYEAHEADKFLQEAKEKPIPGHTLDLTSKKFLKNIQLANDLIKGEMVYVMAKAKNMNVDNLLKQIEQIRELFI